MDANVCSPEINTYHAPSILASVKRPPYTVFAGLYDHIMNDIDYDDWADFILTEITSRGWQGGLILDLACGTGNSAAPLLDRGFEVVGIDASAEMLARAREKHPEQEWLEGRFTDFSYPQRFTLVQSVFDAVNNLLDPADFVLTARRVLKHLEPGGFFVFDVNTENGLRDLWEGGRVEGWAGGSYYRWLHSYDEESGIATVEASFLQDGQMLTEVHRERKYDPAELKELLATAGFSSVEVLDYPEGEEAPEDSPRVWVIARA
jgi:SAM-dependent methyltransferase